MAIAKIFENSYLDRAFRNRTIWFEHMEFINGLYRMHGIAMGFFFFHWRIKSSSVSVSASVCVNCVVIFHSQIYRFLYLYIYIYIFILFFLTRLWPLHHISSWAIECICIQTLSSIHFQADFLFILNEWQYLDIWFQ